MSHEGKKLLGFGEFGVMAIGTGLVLASGGTSPQDHAPVPNTQSGCVVYTMPGADVINPNTVMTAGNNGVVAISAIKPVPHGKKPHRSGGRGQSVDDIPVPPNSFNLPSREDQNRPSAAVRVCATEYVI